MTLLINNDKSRVCFSHIDTQIITYIRNGKDIDSIILELSNKISKFDTMLENISENEPRYKFLMTHNLVCQKRIKDFELILLLMKKNNFSNMNLEKLFNLIKFRDKLLNFTKVYQTR
jgi:hypothetical protein